MHIFSKLGTETDLILLVGPRDFFNCIPFFIFRAAVVTHTIILNLYVKFCGPKKNQCT